MAPYTLLLLVLLIALSAGVPPRRARASSGGSEIRAARVVTNLDSSKTFIHPRIVDEADQRGSEAGIELGIRQGIPGACRLFGMDGYLKDYVVWSSDLRDGVPVGDDGELGAVEAGRYVESMTCTAGQPYSPKISVESQTENADGSVTLRLPQIHHGPRSFPVLSGHAAVCRLLGYSESVGHSLEWSTGQMAGVSLAFDGQIYEKASGTRLTSLRCKNETQRSNFP